MFLRAYKKFAKYIIKQILKKGGKQGDILPFFEENEIQSRENTFQQVVRKEKLKQFLHETTLEPYKILCNFLGLHVIIKY